MYRKSILQPIGTIVPTSVKRYLSPTNSPPIHIGIDVPNIVTINMKNNIDIR